MSENNTPKKSHKVRNIIIGIIAFFVLIAIIQSASSSDDSTEPAASDTTTKTTDKPVKKETKAPAKKKVAKKWTTVTTVKGSTDQETETIKLSDAPKRIKYVVKGGDMSMVGIYLMKEGQNFDEDGGIPEVMVDGAKSDTTSVHKSKGAYYVKVIAANADYTITVQEKK